MTVVNTAEELLASVRARQLPPPGERRNIRQRAGLTLRQVAEAVGVDAVSVMRWEQGSTPRPSRAPAYKQLLIDLDRATRPAP